MTATSSPTTPEHSHAHARPWKLVRAFCDATSRAFASPRLGPLGIAIVTTALFHVVVAFVRPEYWGAQSTWDEGYYVAIAQSGYELPAGDYGQPTRIPFSPGYPLLLRAASWLSGVHPQYLRPAVGAVLYALGCLGLGWALGAFSRDTRRNNLTILVFSVWPGSLYFRSGYAEALYFPLVAFCFGALLRRRWLAAACLAAACWFVRTPAVIVVATLAASIVVSELRTHGWREAAARSLRTLAWALPIASLGFLAYVAILWVSVGDPLAFLWSYVAWEPCEVLTLRALKLKTPVAATLLYGDRPTIKLAVASFLATPILIALQRRRMPVELSLFAGCAWLFFLANEPGLDPFHDTMRWMAIVFPVHFAVVLTLCAPRPPLRHWLIGAWLSSSTAAYLWCVSRFVRNEWVS